RILVPVLRMCRRGVSPGVPLAFGAGVRGEHFRAEVLADGLTAVDERWCSADDVVLRGTGVDGGVLGQVEFGDVVHAHAGAADEHRVVHVQLPTLGGVPDHGGAVAVSDDGVVRSATLVGGAQAVLEVPDRKSTRLNSSHVKISYAVFCLKKKT